MRDIDVLAVSAIARVEVPAALWRKRRMAQVDVQQVGRLIRAFEVDFEGGPHTPPRFAVVTLAPSVFKQAAALTAAHPLRSLDAVQLASGLAARTVDPECSGFACFDLTLRAAAATHGFEPVPPVRAES